MGLPWFGGTADQLPQLLRAGRCQGVISARPAAEPTLAQSFRHQPVAVAVVAQGAQHRVRPIDEHEDGPVPWRLSEGCHAQGDKAVAGRREWSPTPAPNRTRRADFPQRAPRNTVHFQGYTQACTTFGVGKTNHGFIDNTFHRTVR